MVERLLVSSGLAILAVAATTGTTEAASDRTEVMVGTGLVVLGVMAILFAVYLVRHTLRLDLHRRRWPTTTPRAITRLRSRSRRSSRRLRFGARRPGLQLLARRHEAHPKPLIRSHALQRLDGIAGGRRNRG